MTNTTNQRTPPPANAVADDSDNVQIAVVIFTPFDCSGVPRDAAGAIRGLGMDNAIVLVTLGQLLQASLLREGIPCDSLLPLGTAFDGAIRFETPDAFRVDALKATEEFCKGCFWLDIFASVCWFCAAEGAWRAYRNSLNPIRLDKFFTAETDRIHIAALKDTQRILEQIQSRMADSNPPEES